MKLFMFIIVMVSMLTCHATNVHWATLTVEDWGDSYCVFDNYGVVCFYVSTTCDTVANRFTLSFQSDEYAYWPLFENIAVSREGEVVNASTTRYLDDNRYVVHYGIDDNRYFFGEISDVVPSSDIYLSYICSVDPVGYRERQFYYYGWVNLTLGYDGSIYAYGAFDEDGGPVVVGGGAWTGGIPEPSGGMLLLLGVAVLGLKRHPPKHLCDLCDLCG